MGAFKDKVVWITGASSGIGLAAVQQLDGEGAKIVLSSRNEEKLNALRDELKGKDHLVIPLDLEDSSNFRTTRSSGACKVWPHRLSDQQWWNVATRRSTCHSHWKLIDESWR